MPEQPDRATLEAAAEWYAELREAGPESPAHADHQAWLNRSAAHRRAWARIEKLQARLNDAPSEMLRSTLEKARAARQHALKLLMVLVVVGGAMGGWLQTDLHRHLMADYATGTGERDALRLADGSLLALNTATAVNVHFDGQYRRIHLIRGEIQVTTAAGDRARPFIVTTDQGRVRALGTRFLVRSEGDTSRVSVLEHAVAIRPEATEAATRVDTGYQARFTEHRAGTVEPIAGQPEAWTHGQLIVSDWPLGRFLDELARHHTGVIGYNEATAELRISGAFHLDDTDAILASLADTLPVRIRRFTPYWTRVEPLK